MTTDVIIFHDEADQVLGGTFRAHYLWFVPVKIQQQNSSPLFGESRIEYSPLSILYSRMMELRNSYSLQHKLHFTDVAGQKWNRYDLGTRMIIDHSVDAMRMKRPEQFPYPLCCKLGVIAYPRKADKSIYGHPNPKERHLRRIEVILRILLKGTCHYLYDSENTLRISKIITDGQPHHRTLSNSRVVEHLLVDEQFGRSPLRDYVTFQDDADIIHMPSDHKSYPRDSEAYVYANMLQLTDLLGGAGLRAQDPNCDVWKAPPRIGKTGIQKKNVMAYTTREMLMKQKRGKNFAFSGHYRSFTLNKLTMEEGKFVFAKIIPTPRSPTQESLF